MRINSCASEQNIGDRDPYGHALLPALYCFGGYRGSAIILSKRPVGLNTEQGAIIRADFNLPKFGELPVFSSDGNAFASVRQWQELETRRVLEWGYDPAHHWCTLHQDVWNNYDAGYICSPHDYLATRDDPEKLRELLSYLARAAIVQTGESDDNGHFAASFDYTSAYLRWLRRSSYSPFCMAFDAIIADLLETELAHIHVPTAEEAQKHSPIFDPHPLWSNVAIHRENPVDRIEPHSRWFAPLNCLLDTSIFIAAKHPESAAVSRLHAAAIKATENRALLLFTPPLPFLEADCWSDSIASHGVSRLILELLEASKQSPASAAPV